MANLYRVAPVGPAVTHLVPCGFEVVPVGGVGASTVGCNDGHEGRHHDGYSVGHPGKHLLDVLYCHGEGECGVDGNEALDGGIF